MSDKRFSFANTGLVRAEARHVRSSARKVRLVLEDIRGRSVIDARKQLLFSPRAAAKDVELVLRSAVTNAEVNHGLSPDDLVVHEAYADEGVTIKRFRPRARGRASRINKRTSHITILLRSLTSGELVAGAAATEAPAQAATSDRAKRVAASRKADGAEVATDAAETAAEETTAEKPKAAAKPKAAKPKASDAAGEETLKAAKPKAPAKPKAAKAEAGEAEKKPRAQKAAEGDAPAAEKKPRAKKTDEEKG